MAERKYGLLSPSLQAQLHYQALLSRVPESNPLERVINNDPGAYHTEGSSYLPTNSPVDLSVPPLMFGGGTKDSTLPTFKPNPIVVPPSLHQLSTLLRAINAPTMECVTANDYALVLSSQLRKHFDLTLPLSTSPQLTAGEQAAKRKLMLALDDDGGSLELARELIKKLRITIAEQQGRIDELMGVKIGLDAIMTDAKNIRAALEDVRQTVKYQYLDSQDLVLKCGDAFKEMSGVDVFSSKAQLSSSTSGGGKFANSQSSGGLSVIAQEQLKMELERAGVVGGDPFKDRLTTCLYTLSTMKRFITVALQRTPLNPDEAPADAARFDWENDDSVEGKRFRRKFPSVQNLARKLGISAHAPKDRPSEGLPSFMEPLANYNTPSQELALVKAMVSMARDIASAVQLVSILADKAGESVNKSIRSDSNAGSYKSSSLGGGGDEADAQNNKGDEEEDDGDLDTTGSALRIVSLEGDLRVTHEKLAAAEAKLAILEAAGADGLTKSPRTTSKKTTSGITSPTKGSPTATKGAGKSSTKAPPPAAKPKQKPAAPVNQKFGPLKGQPPASSPPRLSKTDLLLERPGTPAPARQGSASMSASQLPSLAVSTPVPPVDTEELGTQTGDEVYSLAEMEAMHQTNQQLETALTSKSERVVELEDELHILRGRLKVLDLSDSSSPDSVHGDVEEHDDDAESSGTYISETDPGSSYASLSDDVERELSTTASALGSPPTGGAAADGSGGVDPSRLLSQYHSDNNLQFGKGRTKSTSSKNKDGMSRKKRRRRRSNPSSSPRKSSLDGKGNPTDDNDTDVSEGEQDDKPSRSQTIRRRSSPIKDQAALDDSQTKRRVSRKSSRHSKQTSTTHSKEKEGVPSPTRRRSSATSSKSQSRRSSRTTAHDRPRRSSSLKGELSKSQSDSAANGTVNTKTSHVLSSCTIHHNDDAKQSHQPLHDPPSTTTNNTAVVASGDNPYHNSSLRLSSHDDEDGELRPSTVPAESFALNTFASSDEKASVDPLPRRDTAPSLKDDTLSGHMGIASPSSQLNSASSNTNATFVETTSKLPTKSSDSTAVSTTPPDTTATPTPLPHCLTPAQIAEVRHRALAGKKGLGTTTATTPGSRGTTGVVDKLRNALSSPLPPLPISDEEARTLAAMNGPPTLGTATKTPPPRVANVRVTEQPLPDGDAVRAAAVEQIRLQLMSMSAASPQRHGTSLTRGDTSATLSPTTSRQIVFAPASPMPGHANPEGLRRL